MAEIDMTKPERAPSFNPLPVPDGLTKLFLEWDHYQKHWAAMAIVGDFWYKATSPHQVQAMQGLYYNIEHDITLAPVPKVTMKSIVKPSEKEQASVDELSKLLGL